MLYPVAVPVVRERRQCGAPAEDPDKPRAATELLRATATNAAASSTHNSRVTAHEFPWRRPNAGADAAIGQPNSSTATGPLGFGFSAVGAWPANKPTWPLELINARARRPLQARCTRILYPHHTSYRIRMAGWMGAHSTLQAVHRGISCLPGARGMAPGACRVLRRRRRRPPRPACGDSVPARAGHRAAKPPAACLPGHG